MKHTLRYCFVLLALATTGLFAEAATEPVTTGSTTAQTTPAKSGKHKHKKHAHKRHHKKPVQK